MEGQTKRSSATKKADLLTLLKRAIESDTHFLNVLKYKYKIFDAVNTIKLDKGEIND